MATTDDSRRHGIETEIDTETDGLLPFCIDDDIRIDVAGLRFGTREEIVEADCNACTYDRARRYVDYPSGVETVVCNGCGHIHGSEYNYQP